MCHRFGFLEKQSERETDISENVYWGVLFLTATRGRKRAKAGSVYDAVSVKPQSTPSEASRLLCHSELSQIEWRGWTFIDLCQPVIGWGLPWRGDMTLGEVTVFSWDNAKEGPQLRASCQQRFLKLRESISQSWGRIWAKHEDVHGKVFLWHLVTLGMYKTCFIYTISVDKHFLHRHGVLVSL